MRIMPRALRNIGQEGGKEERKVRDREKRGQRPGDGIYKRLRSRKAESADVCCPRFRTARLGFWGAAVTFSLSLPRGLSAEI